MIKKTTLALSLFAILSLSTPRQAYGLFGLGDIVLDPANLVENITTASQAVRQYAAQYQTLLEQVKTNVAFAQGLANDAKNLRKDPITVYRQMRNVYERMNTLLGHARIDFATVAGLSQQHESIFGDNTNFSRLPGREHYDQFGNAVSLAERQSREALELLKQVEYQEQNRQVVADAMESADRAEGQLQVQQAASKIAASSFNTLDSINNLMTKEMEMYATANSTEQKERRAAFLKRNRYFCGSADCRPGEDTANNG